jgi:hypothetical protein
MSKRKSSQQGGTMDTDRQRYAVVNGKRVRLTQAETAESLSRRLGLEEQGESLLRRRGQRTEILGGKDQVEAGDELHSMPKIVKGSRLDAELGLLRRVTGRGSPVRTGRVSIEDRGYTGVLIDNVRLDKDKFGVTRSSLLLLLPPDYPRLPPLGCYLRFPHRNADHHFTLQAHYGAPSLQQKGWYWYCVGLGGGFSSGEWAGSWRPGPRAESGHNLSTLFLGALHAVNSH